MAPTTTIRLATNSPTSIEFSNVGGLLMSNEFLDRANARVAFKEENSEPDAFSLDEDADNIIYISSPHTFSKRPSSWSDDEDEESSSSDIEPERKRARTRSLSPISIGSLDKSLDSDGSRDLPWTDYDFLDLRQHPETAYVDKTGCIPQLPDTFRLILLRPPRFGKTVFLSTLTEYYDIRGASQFEERFGSLAATAGTPDVPRKRTQHLCLSFSLSKIRIFPNATEICSGLTTHVWIEVGRFLRHYAVELQLDDPDALFDDTDPDTELNTLPLFAKVFDLVRLRGYTLFVGVDDYDAPTQQRSFMHIECADFPDYYPPTRDVECLLDTYFWGPLRAGADVIAKLFVTGTFSLLTSPNLANLRMLNLTDEPSLQLSCGFTEQEALTFAGEFLDQPLGIAELRRCGQYNFSCDAIAEPVLHPEELILRIAELSGKPTTPYTPHSLPLLSGLLKLVPETSDVFGTVTTNGLIDLLASGTVDIEADGDALHNLDGALTWTTLRALGVLTYDSQGRLRVANDTVLNFIHTHVDPVFSYRYDPARTHFTAFYPGDPKPLLELLSTALYSQTQCAFRSRHFIEPNVHGVFELVMRRTHCMKARRSVDPTVLSPPQDVPVVEMRLPPCDEVHRLALKTLTLRGMWQAANPNGDEPSIDALRKLHGELMEEAEESLMARPYCAPETGATAPVGSFLQAEPGIPVLLAVGGARVVIGHATS
ncbi:hypothetical protein B0H12DRAFT_1149262 [Mycena haematopus]|nr:hypothetical protein B0H12DRAFT_1149262 [Mycena haematopus]